MKLILSHLTGNSNVKAAAYGFAEAGIIKKFYVSLAAFPHSALDRLGSVSFLSEIKRRKFNSSLQPYTEQWPWLEIGRLMASKVGLSGLTDEKGPFYIDVVCKNLDKRVASKLNKYRSDKMTAVYGYEDVAEYTFLQAKTYGIQCLYDLPIGYWRAARRLLDVERQRWPEWEMTLNGFKDSEMKLARKDEELRLADKIFVASSFTAETLKDYPGQLSPVEVIPYGFPAVSDSLQSYTKKIIKGNLKLLFVGSLSQRKGIANLFTAVKRFKHQIQLTIVGNKPSINCNALNEALQEHIWISSLSHDKILKLMRESDVLIFPSLFEGFGLVITEAMSQGTPVITTERTAGPDLIVHGKNGWLVPAGSTTAIQEIIEDLLLHPEKILDAGREALETARQRPWEMYGRELSSAVMKHMEEVNGVVV